MATDSQSHDNSQFHDMELRVFNASPCPVERQGSPPPRGYQGIWQGPVHIENGRAQGSWPYGVLYILTEDEKFFAVFGDSTVLVTPQEGNYLMTLAQNRSVYRQR